MDWPCADSAERAVPSESAGKDGTGLVDTSGKTEEPGPEAAPPDTAATSDRAVGSRPCPDGEVVVLDAQPARHAHSPRTAPVALAESVAAIRCIVTNLA
jgi:hypothetical protein